MKKRKKTDRPSPLPLLFRPFGASVLPGGGYRVELNSHGDRSQLLISGADRILVCTEEEVVLLAKGRRLTVSGEGLICLTYEGGVAEVEGCVRGISLDVGEVIL